MFDLTTGHGTDCTRLSRRQFLRVGGLSAFGLALPQLFCALGSAAASESTSPKKTVNCILMWMQGGPSHIDMFDPKPEAPAEIRGEFGTVPTTLPGIRISEHLPLLARQTDKYSIIRGHDPKNGSHGTADHLMMTGHMFNPATAVSPASARWSPRNAATATACSRSYSSARRSIAVSTAASAASSATSTTRSRSSMTPTGHLQGARPEHRQRRGTDRAWNAAMPCSTEIDRQQKAVEENAASGADARRLLRKGPRPHHLAGREEGFRPGAGTDRSCATPMAGRTSASRACWPAG